MNEIMFSTEPEGSRCIFYQEIEYTKHCYKLVNYRVKIAGQLKYLQCRAGSHKCKSQADE